MSNHKFLVKYSENRNNFDKLFKKSDIGFRTQNSDYFKKLINFLSTIVDQVNFRINDNGIYIISLDSSHVALVDVYIPIEFFNTFNVKDNKIIGINLLILVKIFNHINSNDELIFKINEDKDNVELIFNNVSYKKNYNLKLMEIDEDGLEVSKIEDKTLLYFESRYFNDLIKDFTDIGEIIQITIEENKIIFFSKGDMTDFNMEFDIDSIDYENLQNINQDFGIKYLQNFTKGCNLNKNITIEFAHDYPLKMNYKIMDKGYISYYIAPKINDEDFE